MKFIKYKLKIVNAKYLIEIYGSEVEIIFYFDPTVQLKDEFGLVFYLAAHDEPYKHSSMMEDIAIFLADPHQHLLDLDKLEKKHRYS